MKHLILKVLDRYKDRRWQDQINLGSEVDREKLASEIEATLMQNEQIRQIERALYRGEG